MTAASPSPAMVAHGIRLGTAIGLVLLLAASQAFAETPDAIEAAIRRGVDFRKQGDDEQALREFSKAYEASRSPRALAQVGLAEQALGRWVDAEVHVQGALQVTADAWIQKNRAALQTSLETIAKHLGSLEVLGKPIGAEVRI